jgi:hypothetical protein
MLQDKRGIKTRETLFFKSNSFLDDNKSIQESITKTGTEKRRRESIELAINQLIVGIFPYIST